MENVKHVVSQPMRRSFCSIISELEKHGFVTAWTTLSVFNVGGSQARARWFGLAVHKSAIADGTLKALAASFGASKWEEQVADACHRPWNPPQPPMHEWLQVSYGARTRQQLTMLGNSAPPLDSDIKNA